MSKSKTKRGKTVHTLEKKINKPETRDDSPEIVFSLDGFLQDFWFSLRMFYVVPHKKQNNSRCFFVLFEFPSVAFGSYDLVLANIQKWRAHTHTHAALALCMSRTPEYTVEMHSWVTQCGMPPETRIWSRVLHITVPAS